MEPDLSAKDFWGSSFIILLLYRYLSIRTTWETGIKYPKLFTGTCTESNPES